jgi:peptide chain release factor 2
MAAFDFRLSAFSLVPLLRGTYDSCGAFVAVRARTAVGAPSWVRVLLRVYQRWAERMGFQVEWIDGEPGLHAGDHGDGLLRISGPFAYGLLCGEAGVHRLVCAAPGAGGRRQSHFADVDVVPDCDLPPPPACELHRQTFRSGGRSPYS